MSNYNEYFYFYFISVHCFYYSDLYFNLFLYIIIYLSLCQYNGNTKDLSVRIIYCRWVNIFYILTHNFDLSDIISFAVLFWCIHVVTSVAFVGSKYDNIFRSWKVSRPCLMMFDGDGLALWRIMDLCYLFVLMDL